MDVINDILEMEIVKVLDKMAPVKTFQEDFFFRKWVTGDLKKEMEERDLLRETARISGRQEDWDSYRKIRKLCSY